MSFFKFQNISGSIIYTDDEQKFIEQIPADYKKAWDGDLKDINIEDGKKIRDQLKLDIKERINEIQEPFCIYCGIHFDIVGISEREHIAPKGHHPEYVFVNDNLALACHYCNGSSKKHTKDTILIKGDNYKDCEFSIIHPFYDKYEEEIEFSFKDADLVLSPKNGSSKGFVTIKMFELDGVRQTGLRGGAILRDSMKQGVEAEVLIRQIRENKYLPKK